MTHTYSYTIDQINGLSAEEARQTFLRCCTASRWAEAMVAARPFASLNECRQKASELWLTMAEPDYLEAFEGHPKIGDIGSLRAKYANTEALASTEQAKVQSASESTLKGLENGNREYESRFGFIFIVCATGKSADEMLALLQARLQNDRTTELEIAAEQQHRITALRLENITGKSNWKT